MIACTTAIHTLAASESDPPIAPDIKTERRKRGRKEGRKDERKKEIMTVMNAIEKTLK